MIWPSIRRRLLDAVIVVWLVGTLSFALLHLAPGDPVSALLSDARIAPAVREHWRTTYALDQPIATQYVRYLATIARGDLGYSFSQYRPVSDALTEGLPYSLLLMSVALATSLTCGLLLGAWQAVRGTSRMAQVSALATSAFAAVPEVWVAILLLAAFSAQWRLFPMSGRCDPVLCDSGGVWASFLDLARHLVLPSLTLTLVFTASFARVQRVALADALGDDIMRTARAKGVSDRRALWRHGVRRTLRPIVVSAGLSLPMLVGGAVFVERVFGWPGMGALLVQAIGVRDYPLVTAIALLGSVMVLCGALLTDFVSARLDPQWARAT